jgi:hypothetical protein
LALKQVLVMLLLQVKQQVPLQPVRVLPQLALMLRGLLLVQLVLRLCLSAQMWCSPPCRVRSKCGT